MDFGRLTMNEWQEQLCSEFRLKKLQTFSKGYLRELIQEDEGKVIYREILKRIKRDALTFPPDENRDAMCRSSGLFSVNGVLQQIHYVARLNPARDEIIVAIMDNEADAIVAYKAGQGM